MFDILLCALDDITEPPYLYLKRDVELAAVIPLAYANDLNAISPLLQHAQANADIVSAYNYMTVSRFPDKSWENKVYVERPGD